MSKSKLGTTWEEYANVVQKAYGKPLNFAQLLLVFDSYNEMIKIKQGLVRP